MMSVFTNPTVPSEWVAAIAFWFIVATTTATCLYTLAVIVSLTKLVATARIAEGERGGLLLWVSSFVVSAVLVVSDVVIGFCNTDLKSAIMTKKNLFHLRNRK